MTTPIKFRVTSVMRKSSTQVDTVHYTYDAKGERDKGVRTNGAQWEEIEFGAVIEEHPTIQISNVAGSVILVGKPKIIINDPSLFGTYETGDIIEFIPIHTSKTEETEPNVPLLPN